MSGSSSKRWVDPDEWVRVRHARVNNLKDVSVNIPRRRLVVFTGVSGSGKSSLVFDTVHTEAQRQLIETFGTFARRRLPKLSRPDVDEIANLSTSIVIDQKRLGRTLRSTVGTATEVSTYLRMLFSRCGDTPGIPSFVLGFNHPDGMCPECAGLGKRIRVDTDKLIDPDQSLRDGAITHPDWKVGGWNWREITALDLFDADKPLRDYQPDELDLLLHADGVPIEKQHGGGTYAKSWQGVALRLERAFVDKAEDELPETKRNAYRAYFSYGDCDACGGLRLNQRALAVRVDGVGLGELVEMELVDLDGWLAGIANPVATPLVDKMRSILAHLIDIGVGYLSLNRSVATLSGGESQRLKMARQLDCDLIAMLYILDEPSIGLHPRDVDKLIELLRGLRDKSNSVFVVEHDPAVIAAADYVIELGPEAGTGGGEVCFAGPIDEFLNAETVTADWMRSHSRLESPTPRPWSQAWTITKAHANNLRDVDVRIPRQVLVVLTGVAGSGKSSLINEEFIPGHPEAIVVDQTALSRSSRSTPATYLGLFDHIRKLFANSTGEKASLFSFNSAGACPECKGKGHLAIEMSFLDDVKQECPHCHGRRYANDVLEHTWNGLTIHDVLTLTVAEATEVFGDEPIMPDLQILQDVGLGYLTLGQPLTTLSGGECQRIKLAQQLKETGQVFILDEPTTGLHMADVERLLTILDRLVDSGNSVIVIEHNLDVIAQADWIIDLGPEGGKNGGTIVATGTPEQVARNNTSHTGRHLAKHFTREPTR